MGGSPRVHPLEPVAHQALTHWDIDTASIEVISVSENVVFRVTSTNHAQYVLRIHRPGYHTLDELHSEQIWTAALRQGGLNVPVPVLTREGAFYATVTLPKTSERRHVGIYEWVEGVPLREHLGEAPAVGEVERAYAQIGRIAASIHTVTERWQPPPDFQRHSFDANGMAGEAPFWGRYWDHPGLSPGERQELARIRKQVHRRLKALPRDSAEYGMIHADLHAGNLLTGENKLHVIDFDDAGFGWHQYELAVALFDQQSLPILQSARESLFNGYRQQRPVDDAFFKLVPLFLLVRGLALIGWLMERPEHSRPEFLNYLVESTCDQAASVL